MKELSVFIEESDDWGEYDYRRPFYIVTNGFSQSRVCTKSRNDDS